MKKKYFALVLSLFTLSMIVKGQKSIEFIPAIGNTITPSVNFRNCTGEFSSAFTFSLSFIYHPMPNLGLELAFTHLNPTTYLVDPNEIKVQVYTKSEITIQRLMAGLNYSYPVKKFRPYIGVLFGVSDAVTIEAFDQDSHTGFSWSFQAGTEYFISPRVGLRLNGAVITSPSIPNNSAYFNVGKDDLGYPEFALGAPSSTTIVHWNINFGLVVRLELKKK